MPSNFGTRVLAAGAALAAIAVAPAQQRGAYAGGEVRSDNVPITETLGIDQRLGNQVPGDLIVFDGTDKPKPLKDLFGKRPIVVMPMFYQCQGICLLEQDSLLKTLIKMNPAVGEDFDVVMFSIHPKETPELANAKKRQVLDLYELGRKNRGLTYQPKEEGWHYLTAPAETIEKVTEALGFRYTYNETTGIINHPAGIMILTPDGRVSSYIYGQAYPTRVLEDDVKIASEGKVGREAEVVLLGCVRIDPVTGHRTLVIENVLRVLCVATVISVVASILVMNRKYKSSLPGQGGMPG